MKAALSSETSVDFYQPEQGHIPEYSSVLVTTVGLSY